MSASAWTPVDETASQWKPVDEPAKIPSTPGQSQPPGFLSRLGDDLKGMISMPHAVSPYPGMDLGGKQAIAEQSSAQNESEKQAGYGPVYRGAAALGSGMGMNVPGMEESAREGDIGGVLGHAAAVPVALGASELIGRVGPKAAPPVIRGAAKTANFALAKAPRYIGAAAGSAIGHATGIPGMEVGLGAAGYKAGSSLSKLKVPGENFGRPKPNLPEAPPAEIGQAGGLRTGGKTAPPEPSSGLGNIPVKASEPAEIAPPVTKPTPKNIGDLLDKGLGGRGLKPGVSLRDQAKPAAAATPSDVVPEGHTVADSSALKSYKYDPAKREFTSVTPTGATYIHGDVSPEQFAEFENAPSKGKAYNELKKSATPVGKIVNGQRVNTQPPKSLRSASPDDLTGVLEESLTRAKATRK